ncbi:SAM-dependent methyltransferase [Amycolatopsis sp. NPDC054798]
MNRERLSALAHTRHPIAAPISDDEGQRLLDLSIPHEDAAILDLGCGGAEWLIRALTAHPKLRAVGVDTSEFALSRARTAAAAQGVADRLTLHQQPATEFPATAEFDTVLCIGSTHAFGGLPDTLEAMRAHVRPSGRALLGDAYWDAEPTPAALEIFGDLPDLPELLDQVIAAGWTPAHGHNSTRAELDAYEWSWTGSLTEWALDHPEDPDQAEALAAAAAHRNEWLRDYRDSFGFACVALRA